MNLTCFIYSPLMAILTMFAIAGGPARAEDQAMIVRRAKAATVLVDLRSEGSGTAFCIDQGGVFVTNAHVIKNVGKGGKVTLIYQPGEAAQKVVEATILRTDGKKDLALLLADWSEGGQPGVLELGNIEGIFETAPVIAFGYPFGRLLAPRGAPNSYPNVSVSPGHVTSLRKVNGELEQIQLDASLNPGNSGGPVISDDGKIVGIVRGGIAGTGVNVAIPVDKLKSIFETPVVVFQPPPVPFTKRFEAADFSFRVLSNIKSKVPMSVEFNYQVADQAARLITPTKVGDAYHVRLTPAVPAKGNEHVRITVEGADGSLSGLMNDVTFRCGNRQLKLSQVRHIQFGTNPSVLLAFTGPRTAAVPAPISGPISGLEAAKIDVGGVNVVQVNLQKMPAMRVSRIESIEMPGTYHIVVKRGSNSSQLDGDLTVDNPIPPK